MKNIFTILLSCWCLFLFTPTTIQAQETKEVEETEEDEASYKPFTITEKSNWIYWNVLSVFNPRGHSFQIGYARKINSKIFVGAEAGYLNPRGNNNRNYYDFTNYRGIRIRPFYNRRIANGFLYYGAILNLELINFNDERSYNVDNNFIQTEQFKGRRIRTGFYGNFGVESDLFNVGYIGLSLSLGPEYVNTSLQEGVVPDNGELFFPNGCVFFCRVPNNIKAESTFKMGGSFDFKVGFYF